MQCRGWLDSAEAWFWLLSSLFYLRYGAYYLLVMTSSSFASSLLAAQVLLALVSAALGTFVWTVVAAGLQRSERVDSVALATLVAGPACVCL